MAQYTKQERENAAKELKEIIGDTREVYTILRHTSRSGMFRIIDLFIIKNNATHRIGYKAAIAMGWGYDREREGVKVTGCGMDMGFHLVYELSSLLYRNEDGTCSHDNAYRLKHNWV